MAQRPNLIIEDARIVFRNFAGKEQKYNREGDRNFCVFLDEKNVDRMLDEGWNIKTLQPRDEGDSPQFYMQVSVSFKTRPPRMVMVSSQGRTIIEDEDLVELFDYVDIRTADVTIHPYEWEVNGKAGIKAYLKTLYVTVEEDPLDLKYNHLPLAGEMPGVMAIEAGQGYDIEGEVVG